MRDEIIDSLGEKGAKLVVRVRLHLTRRAKRETKEPANAVTKKAHWTIRERSAP